MRTYVVDLPGGTNSSTVQVLAKGTVVQISLDWVNAAVGKTEVSFLSTSQIGTAQPTKDVLCRVNHSATAGADCMTMVFNPGFPVALLQNVYVHQTGAGNLGSANIVIK